MLKSSMVCFLVVVEVIDEMEEPIQLLVLNGPAERPAKGETVLEDECGRTIYMCVMCSAPPPKLINGIEKDGDHRLGHEISL